MSESDYMIEALKLHNIFEKPIVVWHEGGHRPVKMLEYPDLLVVCEYLSEQYEVKFGNSKETGETLK